MYVFYETCMARGSTHDDDGPDGRGLLERDVRLTSARGKRVVSMYVLVLIPRRPFVWWFSNLGATHAAGGT